MDTKTDTCPACGTRIGELHVPGCDVEPVPYNGCQLIFCFCGRRHKERDRMPWTGFWPGVEECREFGGYSRWVEGQGWVRYGPDEPGAGEDLNRLHEARWDPAKKRYVLKEPLASGAPTADVSGDPPAGPSGTP